MTNRPAIFKFGDVEVREREFSLVKAGEVLPVEPKAFRVLLHLLRSPQKLIPKEGFAVCFPPRCDIRGTACPSSEPQLPCRLPTLQPAPA